MKTLENTVFQQGEGKELSRRCEGCAKDISDRHGNAIYCKKCSKKQKVVRELKRHHSKDGKEREAMLKRKAENERRRLEDPEKLEKKRKASKDWYHNKKKEDPDWYEGRLEKERVSEDE